MPVNYIRMRQLYENTEKCNAIIAEHCSCDTSTVSRWASANFDAAYTKARGIAIKLKNHGEPHSLHQGYTVKRTPTWYTGKYHKHDYVFEHHLVYLEANGLTELPAGMVIHHKDDNRLNNDLANLAMVSRGEHTAHHHKGVANYMKGNHL